MASSLETYSTLLTALAPREKGGSFAITQQDADALCGLTKGDLVDQGFKVREAKRVADALAEKDLQPLAESLGLAEFCISPIAISLGEPKPTRTAREAALAEYLRTDQRKETLIAHIRTFLPAERPTPPGNMLVKTILAHEYPSVTP
jgi:hypothetical protein